MGESYRVTDEIMNKRTNLEATAKALWIPSRKTHRRLRTRPTSSHMNMPREAFEKLQVNVGKLYERL
jgi:hypothetical protein